MKKLLLQMLLLCMYASVCLSAGDSRGGNGN